MVTFCNNKLLSFAEEASSHADPIHHQYSHIGHTHKSMLLYFVITYVYVWLYGKQFLKLNGLLRLVSSCSALKRTVHNYRNCAHVNFFHLLTPRKFKLQKLKGEKEVEVFFYSQSYLDDLSRSKRWQWMNCIRVQP